MTDLVAPELMRMVFRSVGGDGNGVNATEEEPYSSWWLDWSESRMATLSSRSTPVQPKPACGQPSPTILCGLYGDIEGDPITVSAGDTIELDPVWIHAGFRCF